MTAVREACHNILYTGVNSAAMNGVDENTRIVSVLPLWQTWLIAFDCVVVALVLVGVVCIVRRCRKNTAAQTGKQ